MVWKNNRLDEKIPKLSYTKRRYKIKNWIRLIIIIANRKKQISRGVSIIKIKRYKSEIFL